MLFIQFYRRVSTIPYFALLVGLVFSGCGTDVKEEGSSTEKRRRVKSGAVTHIEPDAQTGFSLATVVQDVPLAFTNQLLPFDEHGNIVGSSNVTEQLDQVIKNAELALKASGADLSDVARINLYLKDDTMSEQVLERLKEILPDETLPAITFVSGKQPLPEVLVSMDLVAVADEGSEERVSLYQAEGISGKDNRSHVAVLAPGRKIFISGQAVSGEDLSDASHQTMRNLFATLAYVGSRAEDVVQVKAFFNPIDSARAVEEIIASFFRDRKAPPIISVEWVSDPNRIEIELIASAEANDSTHNDAVRYYAPPWMTQATTFSRIVDVKSGGLFFTSGLYGEGQDDQTQARDIFKKIEVVLQKAGSNYDHLVKATYYPSSEGGRQGFVTVRPDFYNPEKPPAASLIRVQGTGRQDRSINVDLIGAIPQ